MFSYTSCGALAGVRDKDYESDDEMAHLLTPVVEHWLEIHDKDYE